ncbi:GNAT family N-acetyltransferase [Nonomuraea fastidiosa]|uniref:GNAT family N-acetyltransferase n=1 Tax=Nonomuraea TaxID=83681 RepID=UPI003251684F
MSAPPTLSTTLIPAARVLLRPAREADRAGIVEIMTDPEVRTYLGGPRPRAKVESFLDAHGVAAATGPGSYVVADPETDRFLGTLTLDRRDPERPGHVTEAGWELELSYVLRRFVWGAGPACEAATAALRAAAAELPDRPVLVVTQTANERSLRLASRLGFETAGTFEEFGAQQTLAVAALGEWA